MPLSEAKNVLQASSSAATYLSLGLLVEKKTTPKNNPKHDMTFTPWRSMPYVTKCCSPALYRSSFHCYALKTVATL